MKTIIQNLQQALNALEFSHSNDLNSLQTRLAKLDLTPQRETVASARAERADVRETMACVVSIAASRHLS